MGSGKGGDGGEGHGVVAAQFTGAGVWGPQIFFLLLLVEHAPYQNWTGGSSRGELLCAVMAVRAEKVLSSVWFVLGAGPETLTHLLCL